MKRWPELSEDQKAKYVVGLAAGKAIGQHDIDKFIYTADTCRLDPLQGEMYLFQKGGKWLGVTRYTVHIRRGWETGRLQWWQANKLELVPTRKEGIMEYAATCLVKAKDLEEVFDWTVFENDASTRVGSWAVMMRFMLRKVAISQAFRFVFPEVAALPYSTDEIELDITPPAPPDASILKEIAKKAA